MADKQHDNFRNVGTMSEQVLSAVMQRRSKIIGVEEVLDQIEEGMTVGIGGFINSAHPMIVVRGLIRRGFRKLTIVGAASAGLEIDLLIAAGCVAKVATPYISGEKLAPIGPAFRAAAEAGKIEVYELDEALYYCALRAAAQRVPFNPWKSGVGTSFPERQSRYQGYRRSDQGRKGSRHPGTQYRCGFFTRRCVRPLRQCSARWAWIRRPGHSRGGGFNLRPS